MTVLYTKPRRKRPRLGPYTRSHSLTAIDGRCRAARTIRDFTAELERYVGDPTPPQQVLIREAAIKNCKLELLADKILAGDELDLDLASRCYLAWSNSLRRDLEALGLERPEQQLAAPLDYLAAKRKSAA